MAGSALQKDPNGVLDFVGWERGLGIVFFSETPGGVDGGREGCVQGWVGSGT